MWKNKPFVDHFCKCCFVLVLVSFSVLLKAQNLSIIGEIEGAGKQKVFLEYYDGTKMVKDSITPTNGSFTFNVKGAADQRFRIILDKERYFTFFYTDPVTKVHIKSLIDQSYVENPSDHQLDLLRHEQVEEEFRVKNQGVLERYNTLYRRYGNSEAENNAVVKDSLKRSDDERALYFRKGLDLEFQYLKDNPRSLIAIDKLALRSTRAEGKSRMADFMTAHALLPEDIKDGYFGKRLLMAIERLKRLHAVEVLIPDFSAVDINRDTVSLSQYKNQKYVLIDFWASWCIPCREDHPQLVELYYQYNVLIEFVSISLDTNLDAWKGAIKEDQVSAWTHLAVEENPQVNFRRRYDVAAIPIRILVDQEGKVVKRWQGMNEEHIQELVNILRTVSKQ